MQSRFINPFRLPLSPYLNCNAACQASTCMCLNAFHRHCVAYLPNASQINAADSKVKCNTCQPVRSADAIVPFSLPPTSA